jgi:hypothetical protein
MIPALIYATKIGGWIEKWATSKKFMYSCKFKPFDPHNVVSYPATMQNTIHICYGISLVLSKKFSTQRKYIMEHFSSPHKHIVREELQRKSVRVNGGKEFVWKLFPDVDFELSCILNEFHDIMYRKLKCFSATLCCLRACNVIKKFDFGNLILTPISNVVSCTPIFMKVEKLSSKLDEFLCAVTNYSRLQLQCMQTLFHLCDLSFSPFPTWNISANFSTVYNLLPCVKRQRLFVFLSDFFLLS